MDECYAIPRPDPLIATLVLGGGNHPSPKPQYHQKSELWITKMESYK